MTPQLCRFRLVSQTSSLFVEFCAFFSVWSVSSVFPRPVVFTAELRGVCWALLVAISTQQLLLRHARLGRWSGCGPVVVPERRRTGPSTSESSPETAQGSAACTATKFGVWVAVDMVAVDVSQCSRELPSVTGFSVWAAVDRVAMNASLVMFR